MSGKSFLKTLILTTATLGCMTMADDRALEHECTSWILFPNVTGGKYILHKNRDAPSRDVTICKWSKPDKHKWIGLGSGPYPCMGISEKGLAIVSNSGEVTFENEPAQEGRMTLPVILKYLFENTSTAAEAVAEFQNILERRAYTHKNNGSIVFILDTKEGYILECTAHHAIVVKMTEGIHVRANIWHNPGMEIYKRNSFSSTMNSALREYMTTGSLNDALVAEGKITLDAIRRTSRLRGDPDNSGALRGICCKTTNSASTLVADIEFPDVLSTAFVVIGPPRHSVYIPVPICIDEIPSDIADFSWSHAAFARLDAEGIEVDFDIWKPFEDSMQEAYMNAEEKARLLLREGKREEAIATMRALFTETCNRARELALKPPKPQE